MVVVKGSHFFFTLLQLAMSLAKIFYFSGTSYFPLENEGAKHQAWCTLRVGDHLERPCFKQRQTGRDFRRTHSYLQAEPDQGYGS